MARYTLDQLLDWVRRDGGDKVTTFREDLEPDGTKRVAINNDGSIRLTLVERDNAEIEEGTDFELSGNLLVFNDVVEDGTAIYVEYQQSLYSDDEIMAFIADAAKKIAADLNLKWTVDEELYEIDDVKNELFNDKDDPAKADARIEKLIVLAAAIAIAEDKAKSAADDAINIKDGDTSIATAENAKAQERRLARLNEQFRVEMNYCRANRFTGVTTSEVG